MTPFQMPFQLPWSFPTVPPAMTADPFGLGAYLADVAQRNILFLDVMRQRGNQYLDHMAEALPHVLVFETSLVMDGAALPRPVNYSLFHVIPPTGSPEPRPGARPFLVVDPRAGHGPGIGGFKGDSAIGAAIAAGHPCYFMKFAPEPLPGQTIEHVIAAEAAFVAEIARRHPDAEGRPCVVGNCQAGWQSLMAAAARPDRFGPLILAGAPVSYWHGTRGFAPMRYTGGMLGGSWLAHLFGDMGAGVFDGAWLVSNFENLNPANTLWSKQYNLWSRIDTEAPRYLGFERWWGGHVLLNVEEIGAIVDHLFVGNRFSSGELLASDGTAIDIRDVRSPILVFCSRGDDITPPAQALGWILDLYDDVSEIRAHGQTIIYSVHDSIGHLGIFVSSRVARKEQREFTENIDLVDVLPPGLYEAVMRPKAGLANAEMIRTDYIMAFEPRTLDDIRAFGANTPEEDRAFAAVQRVSDVNLGLYRQLVQPIVRATASPQLAETMRRLHPARLPYETMSDRNPAFRIVEGLAETARASRVALAPDNPFLAMQQGMANAIESGLRAWGEARDRMIETAFFAVWGSPFVQALAGVLGSAPARHRPGRDPGHHAMIEMLKEQLHARISEGGVPEAFLRGLMHVRDMVGADERSFLMLQELRGKLPQGPMALADFKAMLRDQSTLMLLHRDEAVAAIPDLLPDDAERRGRILVELRRVAEATGPLTEQQEARFSEVERLFGVKRAANDETTPPVKRQRKGG